ncbi:MAG: sugar transferase [Hyphomicrobiales bacterium]
MYKNFLKRLIDFVIALIAIIILLPFMIPIIIILLLTGEHYVFYLQKRMGYKNIKFNIWKFATMLKNSPNIGAGSLTVRNDPRVLPIGGFLRKTKINELPQLVNVLIGNMSIVGPRPQMEVDFLKFPEEIQKKVYSTKPGITGIGSIIFRDEEQYWSKTSMDPHEFDKKIVAPYKGELELWYQKKQSLILDIKIIFLTAWVILFPKSNLMEKWFDDLPERPKELL